MTTIDLNREREQLAQLETMVDAVGLPTVLSMLATVAYEKASHVKANWQDAALAKAWDAAGTQLDKWAAHDKLKLH